MKPFTAWELLARVQTHMELARARSFASRERERRAEQERQRFAAMFESTPAIIALLRGPDHVFDAANDAYRAVVGKRELIGKSIRAALPELEGQGYFELLDRVFATGEPYVASESRALLRRHPGGDLEEVFFNFAYQPVRESDGTVTGVFLHAFDVTGQVRARQQIHRLYERVREANAATMQFLAAMSHELRTPLNAILGYADLLTVGVRGALTDSQQVDVARIQSAGRYLLSLINDILNFTRLEAGHVDFDIRPMAIRGVLESARELVGHPMAERGLRLDYSAPPESVVVLADPERAQQVL